MGITKRTERSIGFLKSIVTGYMFLSLFLCLMVMAAAPGNISASTCEQWVAKAVSVEGRVEVKRAGSRCSLKRPSVPATRSGF